MCVLSCTSLRNLGFTFNSKAHGVLSFGLAWLLSFGSAVTAYLFISHRMWETGIGWSEGFLFIFILLGQRLVMALKYAFMSAEQYETYMTTAIDASAAKVHTVVACGCCALILPSTG